jgi:hypothetical protein
MTTIRTVNYAGSTIGIRVNGRFVPTSRIQSLAKIGAARWFGVMTNGLTFHIEGGKGAGGSARDWFLDLEHADKAIACTSAADALRCVDGM